MFFVLKLWHCYFPFEFSSILGYWIFGFRSFMLKHLSLDIVYIVSLFIIIIIIIIIIIYYYYYHYDKRF